MLIRILQLDLDLPVEAVADAVLIVEGMIQRIDQEHAHGHAAHHERQKDPFQLQ